MKALILNSGIGSRMGALTQKFPKCMTHISNEETIISRQLKQLVEVGIKDIVITTGSFADELVSYCKSLNLDLNFTFIKNSKYKETNYIYSIYLAKDVLEDDIILIHGDLVFETELLERLIDSPASCMAVDSYAKLPDKDFKAQILGDTRIRNVGIDIFDKAIVAQPIYKLLGNDWRKWLSEIIEYTNKGITNCYAEDALNNILENINLYGMEVGDFFCSEIDNIEDLDRVKQYVISKKNEKSVYVCFSTDIIHGGHISIIQKAKKLGHVTVGILSDKAVASFKRYPLLGEIERTKIITNINGVDNVIQQNHLSYREVLQCLKPDYVVHGDDWKESIQQTIRMEVISILREQGGLLVEYPYCMNENYEMLEKNARKQLAMPDFRRGRLRKILEMKKLVTAIESHSGITGIIAEKTTVVQDGKILQFDAMWVSSLCDSTAKGKPDIELVDMSSRLRTIDDIMEVTTKPIILDGDTGGLTEHFVYNVKTLERIGVSAIIIEDKIGLKKNSLFGTDVKQYQDSISNFCDKIRAGKMAQNTKEFMIIARIESLILEQGMEDALNRAFAYVEAGADGIMIHSRNKNPDEIFEFVRIFREKDSLTPIVVVPTSFNSVTEEEFQKRGVNIVIYANQLTRSGFPAMQKAAQLILENHRAKEADNICMSIKEILTLIPEEE